MAVTPEGKVLFLICRVVVALVTLALVYGTAAPLIRSDQWWIRILDFPRLQIAGLLGLTLACYAVLHLSGVMGLWDYALAATAVLALVWQLISVAPYTALYPREMADSHAEDDSNHISLLIFNVLHENLEVQALRDLIHDNDPDIILLTEPTQWWFEQLDGLEEDYPHTLFQPQENNYGLLLYSRFALKNPEIRFLIEPAIPSIRTGIILPSGTVVTLYGVHPRPPGLRPPDNTNDDEREDSDMRDAELLSVAREIKEAGDVPVIVAGDFNDVAWSYTTHLFQRIGGLLDPRVGRGVINTFDTRSRLMRFPLDHVFASHHFLLVELRRLPDIGSDHYPFLAVLDFDHDAFAVNDEPQPDAGDEQAADEAIEEGKSDD